MVPHATDDYDFTFDNRVGGTQISHEEDTPYKVSEHILWAPRKLRVASIGAGPSGLMMCYKKEKEFGDSIDLVVYERQTDVGGVWHTNRYPGCRCDVPSAGYQFSFAPKSDWSRYYSPAREIQEYYADFARKGAYVGKYINLKHEVTKAEWDESTSQWVLMISKTTDAGTETFEDRVDFVDGNIGVLNTWKWPDIPNREAFKGQMAHSADYDTSISVEGKRVAVIGSGASSIQIIPAIQKTAAEVIAFYRTPQWISTGVSLEGLTDLAGSNFDYTEEQKARFRDDPAYYLTYRKAIEQKINAGFPTNIQTHAFQKMGRQMIEKRMAAALGNDPKLMKRMIPDFPLGCRRLGPAEGFLECFLQSNVTLAEGDIKTFTEKGIKTSTGQEYEADVIICATGFDVSFKPYFPVIGRDGRTLAKEWADDPNAYMAMAAHGFPNFMTGHGSFVTVLEVAQNYICKLIRKLQTENIRTIDVKESAVAEYNQHVHEWLKRTVWSAGCRSWYNQGRPGGKLTAQYPGSLVHWWKLLEHPRFEDYDITYRSKNRFEFMGNGFTQVEVDKGDLSWYLDPDFINKPLFDH